MVHIGSSAPGYSSVTVSAVKVRFYTRWETSQLTNGRCDGTAMDPAKTFNHADDPCQIIVQDENDGMVAGRSSNGGVSSHAWDESEYSGVAQDEHP